MVLATVRACSSERVTPQVRTQPLTPPRTGTQLRADRPHAAPLRGATFLLIGGPDRIMSQPYRSFPRRRRCDTPSCDRYLGLVLGAVRAWRALLGQETQHEAAPEATATND